MVGSFDFRWCHKTLSKMIMMMLIPMVILGPLARRSNDVREIHHIVVEKNIQPELVPHPWSVSWIVAHVNESSIKVHVGKQMGISLNKWGQRAHDACLVGDRISEWYPEVGLARWAKWRPDYDTGHYKTIPTKLVTATHRMVQFDCSVWWTDIRAFDSPTAHPP